MNACVGARGFLIDGFPRNQRNLDGWQRLMSDKVRVRFVLVLTAPTDVLLKRCLGRGRSDDNEETLKKRILRYNDETMPVVQHFEAQRIIRTIDGFRERNEVPTQGVRLVELWVFLDHRELLHEVMLLLNSAVYRIGLGGRWLGIWQRPNKSMTKLLSCT